MLALVLADRGIEPDLAAVAKATGMRPNRTRALLDARLIPDESIDTVAAAPGQLRRPRLSTIRRLLDALGLEPAVADWLHEYAPANAFAPEPR